jgi:hypothetical protein
MKPTLRLDTGRDTFFGFPLCESNPSPNAITK